MKPQVKEFHIYPPANLVKKIAKLADMEHRSLNKQIIFLLVQALKGQKAKEQK